MTVLKDDRVFTIDTMDKPGVQTSRGWLPSRDGIITTRDAALAAEVKENELLMLVYEHETPQAGRAARSVWVMPEMPWKRKSENSAGSA